MKRSNSLILAIVILDAIGIGIVFPTLPLLLRSLLHGGSDVARHFGLLLVDLDRLGRWCTDPMHDCRSRTG